MFRQQGMSDKEVQRFTSYASNDKGYNREEDVYNRMFMFSPAYRHKVAENVGGKGGLGYGLSAKIVMQNWKDYIANNGGSIEFPYEVYVNNTPVEYIAKVSLKDGKVQGQTKNGF